MIATTPEDLQMSTRKPQTPRNSMKKKKPNNMLASQLPPNDKRTRKKKGKTPTRGRKERLTEKKKRKEHAGAIKPKATCFAFRQVVALLVLRTAFHQQKEGKNESFP